MANSDPKPLPQLSQKDIDRFWSHVDKRPGQGPNGDCHCWLMGLTQDGYGKFKAQRQTLIASRVAYFLATGKDPAPLNALHTCDNRPCCNGEHLFEGTPDDNIQDKIRKGRARYAKGEKHFSRTRPERVARGDRNGARTHPERIPRGARHGLRLHPECIARGERISNHTNIEIQEIRDKYATGQYSYVQLAKEYGYKAPDTIGKIVRGDRWRHIK